MKGQRNCSLSAWFPSLEKCLERNGLENSYLILTWLEFSDFALLVETWAGDFSDLSVPGYNLIQLNRVEKKKNTKRNSGGVALYIEQSYYSYCTLLAKDWWYYMD